MAARSGHAATSCALPPQFDLHVEQRTVMERGAVGIVVTAASDRADVAPGDVVRQANGVRVQSCDDVERAAAEALARGLVLLLGVERSGRLLAVAAVTPADAPRIAARPPNDATASGVTGSAATTQDGTARREAAPPAVVRPAPGPRRQASLPPNADGSPALRARAAEAAAVLATVDEVARTAVPLALYERRLGDAEATIAKLGFGIDGAETAVRDVVEEALALHRTARDIRRAKLEALGRTRTDQRRSTGTTLPYFSDSKVGDWVAAYPFLQAAILSAPRETRMLVPGESSGRWNPDEALGMLWERAHAARTSLAAWSVAA